MSVDVKTSNFRPLELNERNVNTLFKRCLPDERNSFEGLYPVQVLSSKHCGRESEVVRLSEDKISVHKTIIRYLLGQIKAFHGDNATFALQEGFMRYDGTVWTKDYDVLFKLYSMGLATVSISDFSLYKDIIGSVKSTDCIPTLSPRDPNFSEWYEGYKNTHPEFE